MDKKLSAKQKNCVVRNNIIQRNAKDVTRGLASERNEFEKRMNVEAKKLLMRFTKTAEIKHDNDERMYELCDRHPSPKLPVIHHPADDSQSDDAFSVSRSAPGSPYGFRGRRNTLQPLPQDGAKVSHSLFPPNQPLPGIRRGSCPDLDQLNLQLVVPRHTTSRRGSIGPHHDVYDPLMDMPRNLATRERARRRASSFSDLELPQDVGTKTPSLEEQFQALSSCRYLRD